MNIHIPNAQVESGSYIRSSDGSVMIRNADYHSVNPKFADHWCTNQEYVWLLLRPGLASETKDDCESPAGKKAEGAGCWGAAWFLRVKGIPQPNVKPSSETRGLQLKLTILFPDLPDQCATFGTHYTTYARPYAPRPAFKPARPRNSQRWGLRAHAVKCAAEWLVRQYGDRVSLVAASPPANGGFFNAQSLDEWVTRESDLMQGLKPHPWDFCEGRAKATWNRARGELPDDPTAKATVARWRLEEMLAHKQLTASEYELAVMFQSRPCEREVLGGFYNVVAGIVLHDKPAGALADPRVNRPKGIAEVMRKLRVGLRLLAGHYLPEPKHEVYGGPEWRTKMAKRLYSAQMARARSIIAAYRSMPEARQKMFSSSAG